MLGEVFYWVFNMSITASVTGLLILVLGRVKKIPRRITVFLWAVPFLRMILPLGLNSPWSLLSLLSGITAKTVVVYRPAEDVAFSMMNSVMAAESYFPIVYKAEGLERVFRIASGIWGTVLLAILLLLAVLYRTTLRELEDAEKLRGNIYFSEKTVTPAVYGILKPKIVLPLSCKERDVELILLHEKIHVRRGDNLWRILGFVAAAVHWFNPLCWVFLKGFLADLELSCDERVLMELGEARRKEYALSLLESRQSTAVFASAFGGARIRTRIENILSFRKMTRFSLVAFIALTVIIFCVLLTNRV